MYKKILIFGFLFVFITTGVNAGSCLIEDGPPDSLIKYLENNNSIIRNITSEISKSNLPQDKKIGENVTGIFNNIINWSGYFSYFEYYVSYPPSNDITKEVKRDYRLLENEGEGLNNYLQTVSKKGYNIQINNACKGIEIDCQLSGNALDIIGKLIKNNSYIIDIYRKAVMGNDISGYKLILVDNENDSFVEDIKIHYGSGNGCINSEDSFLSTIWKKIKSIGKLNKQAEDGIQEWRDAIVLINGDNVSSEDEEELLVKELSRQGISGEKTAAIVGNLQKFNCSGEYSNTSCTGGYSLSNNFVSNSFGHLGKQVTDQIKDFKKDVIQEFLNSDNNETKTINSILNDSEKIEVNLDIAESVSSLYNSELPFIEIGDKNTILIRTDIINMHNNLNNAIKTLEKTIEIAEKVCNDQDTGNGKCSTD